MFLKAKGFPAHRRGKSFLLSRMESRRTYDLFPFISAPVKCGFRKALVMSMISRAVIFEIVTFFIFAACSLLSGSRYPFSRSAYRRERYGVWVGWHILTFLDILILQRITICSRLYKEDI